MAAVKMFYIFCVVLFTAVSCQDEQGNPGENNNYIPAWVNCNYTENPGSSCVDCNTQLICTRVGGFEQPCWSPRRPYCVDGRCASEPSAECAPNPAPNQQPISTGQPGL